MKKFKIILASLTLVLCSTFAFAKKKDNNFENVNKVDIYNLDENDLTENDFVEDENDLNEDNFVEYYLNESLNDVMERNFAFNDYEEIEQLLKITQEFKSENSNIKF